MGAAFGGRMKKQNRGGKRKGSGRKPKYNEPTETISFRVPVSKTAKVKEAVKKIIKPPLH